MYWVNLFWRSIFCTWKILIYLHFYILTYSPLYRTFAWREPISSWFTMRIQDVSLYLVLKWLTNHIKHNPPWKINFRYWFSWTILVHPHTIRDSKVSSQTMRTKEIVNSMGLFRQILLIFKIQFSFRSKGIVFSITIGIKLIFVACHIKVCFSFAVPQ